MSWSSSRIIIGIAFMIRQLSIFLILVIPNIVLAKSFEDDALQHITNSKSLSCGTNESNALHFDACKGPAGAYQFVRIALAINSYAKALKEFGFSDLTSSIEKELFRDVATFGLELGLSQPAMNLADLAANDTKNLGNRSEKVLGFSMMALEYVYPGLNKTTGINMAKIGALTETDLIQERGGYHHFLEASEKGFSSLLSR